MNINFNQIRRENVKLCHGVEYILIDDFFDIETFTTNHANFLLDYFVIEDFGDICSLSGHPLVELLYKHEQEFLNAVNSVWDEACIANKAAATLLPAGKSLPIHNDTHWDTVPVRGVLYLNDVCGTTFHSSKTGNDPIDIGGKANQLLLFKVTDSSFHSVGLLDHSLVDRFSVTMMFDKVGKA